MPACKQEAYSTRNKWQEERRVGARLELGRKTASWKMSEGMLKPNVTASSICNREKTATLDNFSPCQHDNKSFFKLRTAIEAACSVER